MLTAALCYTQLRLSCNSKTTELQVQTQGEISGNTYSTAWVSMNNKNSWLLRCRVKLVQALEIGMVLLAVIYKGPRKTKAQISVSNCMQEALQVTGMAYR